MNLCKTDEEIELMKQSNLLVTSTLAELAKLIQPGVTTKFLDRVAEDFIRSHGGIPSFLGYGGFPNTLCTSVNCQVVHGIPSDEELKEGDILSVDCGAILNGYHGDCAYTFAVGNISDEVRKLLNVTKACLFIGAEKAIEGNRLGDVGAVIQQHAESNGFSVVREMVGHGIGTNLHEKPEVPNYGRKGTGPKLLKNQTICIEPMINMGSKNIVQENDGWTVRTKDRKPSAHFELPVAVKEGKSVFLSSFEKIEEVLNK
ncbi:MAG: type I methionyl aminopeptidase [Bacteroidota bacterium]|nr:type I methionyl aminopeptidase [Bacteroidota bacterium]